MPTITLFVTPLGEAFCCKARRSQREDIERFEAMLAALSVSIAAPGSMVAWWYRTGRDLYRRREA